MTAGALEVAAAGIEASAEFEVVGKARAPPGADNLQAPAGGRFLPRRGLAAASETGQAGRREAFEERRKEELAQPNRQRAVEAENLDDRVREVSALGMAPTGAALIEQWRKPEGLQAWPS